VRTEIAVHTACYFHRGGGVFHQLVMVRGQLQAEQWAKMEGVLASLRGAGRRGSNDRNFIEAVLWWRRTGVPWRDLPDEFGPWKTVFNRFDRWSKTGRWTRLFEALRTGPDDEWHSLDSTINRAHQHAAGGKGGRPPKGSAGRAEDLRRRCTWSSTRSACR
jgi:putative transposase